MASNKAPIAIVAAVLLIVLVALFVPAPKNNEMEGTYYLTEEYVGYYSGGTPCIDEHVYGIDEQARTLDIRLVKDSVVRGTYDGIPFVGTYDGTVATFSVGDDIVGGDGRIFYLVKEKHYIYVTSCSYEDGTYTATSAAFFSPYAVEYTFNPPEITLPDDLKAVAARCNEGGIVSDMDTGLFSMKIDSTSHGLIFYTSKTPLGTATYVGAALTPDMIESITSTEPGSSSRIAMHIAGNSLTSSLLYYDPEVGNMTYTATYADRADVEGPIPNLNRVSYSGEERIYINGSNEPMVDTITISVKGQYHNVLTMETTYGSVESLSNAVINEKDGYYRMDVISSFTVGAEQYRGYFTATISSDLNICRIVGLADGTTPGKRITIVMDLERTEHSKDLSDVVGTYDLHGYAYAGYESGLRILKNYTTRNVMEAPLSIYSITNGIFYGNFGGLDIMGTFDGKMRFSILRGDDTMSFEGTLSDGVIDLTCLSYNLSTGDYGGYYLVFVKQGISAKVAKPATGLGGLDILKTTDTWLSYKVNATVGGYGARVYEQFTLDMDLQGPGLSFAKVHNMDTGVTRNTVCVNNGYGTALALCINKGAPEFYNIGVSEETITATSTSNDDGMSMTTSIYFSKDGSKKGEGIIPDINDKMYVGTDFYIVNEKTYSVPITITIGKQFEESASVQSEFGGRTSTWSLVMDPTTGLRFDAAAFFNIGGETFQGSYVGMFNEDHTVLTISGTALSASGNALALWMDLRLQE